MIEKVYTNNEVNADNLVLMGTSGTLSFDVYPDISNLHFSSSFRLKCLNRFGISNETFQNLKSNPIDTRFKINSIEIYLCYLDSV